MTAAIKRAVKFAVLALMHVLVSPLGLTSRASHRLLKSEALFDIGAKFLCLAPGLPGQYLRNAFYQQTLLHCGRNLVVAFGAFFSHPTARVGNGVSIGAYSIIGTADIGDDVQIASRVSVLSGKYQHGRPGEHAEVVRAASFERLNIGASGWIGEGAIIMADVGAHSVIGAGSIVVKPVPERHRAVGNPARSSPIISPATASQTQ